MNLTFYALSLSNCHVHTYVAGCSDLHDQSKALVRLASQHWFQETQQERRTARKGRAPGHVPRGGNMRRASVIQIASGGKNTRDDPKLNIHLLHEAGCCVVRPARLPTGLHVRRCCEVGTDLTGEVRRTGERDFGTVSLVKICSPAFGTCQRPSEKKRSLELI